MTSFILPDGDEPDYSQMPGQQLSPSLSFFSRAGQANREKNADPGRRVGIVSSPKSVSNFLISAPLKMINR
jgi:hypothetical protein